MTRPFRDLPVTRRQWMRMSALGAAAVSCSGWIEALAADAASAPGRRRSCILLWMNGGPSQTDTFDLKPGHKNGGPFEEIETSVPGIRISEHLPKLARRMDDLAIIRSMSTKEGDHGRASYHLRTGYMPTGPIAYPTFGSLVSKELADPRLELPGFVSIAPFRGLNPAAYAPGFLGHRFAPLIVGESDFGRVVSGGDGAEALKVKDLSPPSEINRRRADARLGLLADIRDPFLDLRSSDAAYSQRTAYENAITMMRSDAVKAFDLDDEPDHLRDAYGRNTFGQGCLLARRLVERGVPFVEVTLNGVDGNNILGWDTHQDNFEAVRRLSEVLDPAWATLMDDLKARGLLDSTLIVWMGEFGRTPTINGNNGRDHFPNAWSAVVGGGGIAGGRVIGATTADGTEVEDRPVAVPDLLATACLALGLDPMAQNMSNLGRPIRVVDPEAKPIREVLA
ncbi:DUF1501 domain-containing protein [Tautonia sociabilis]|uniref:DUF1501 domain-containing protein n=1 Tax=Tautonia sociabilis TaxID=2080755 RepID=A0A432MDC0_9BACT|nr:DUF1501 domain-containing protein [Tautonia sociabilis]RUL81853.1 DUF1501 domain-containing protein [Tautonia sociabilis]